MVSVNMSRVQKYINNIKIKNRYPILYNPARERTSLCPNQNASYPAHPPLNDKGLLIFDVFGNTWRYNVYIYIHLIPSRHKVEENVPRTVEPITAVSIHSRNNNVLSWVEVYSLLPIPSTWITVESVAKGWGGAE